MNEILSLKGEMHGSKGTGRPGPAKLKPNTFVSSDQMIKLYKSLKNVKSYWVNNNKILEKNLLVSAYYKETVPKSNRLKSMLKPKGYTPNDVIVGAKFSNDLSPKHIITYCVSMDVINDTLNRMQICIDNLHNKFNDKIDNNTLDDVTKKGSKYKLTDISKTYFSKLIVDSYYINKFDVEEVKSNLQDDSIVSIYDIGEDLRIILKKVGIDVPDDNILSNDTFFLTPNDLNILKNKAPFLISMAVSDISDFSYDDSNNFINETINIENPNNEPIVGVIDTIFKDDVYFSNWVESHNMLDTNIIDDRNISDHGTEVSSIIVDGPSSNKKLNDGCGHFRVRHFGVSDGHKMSSFSIMKKIKTIIETNKDIKVWNLSLGSSIEISKNFISPEGAFLDKIQNENDVIFIIAGTNKPMNANDMKIGAPADSINSIVVNSTDYSGNPASYSRQGPVLSFFNKPDICCFGGDKQKGEFICVCTPLGEYQVTGTSFAAPWITRKVAYMIYNLNFSIETTKALIVDSAAGWNDDMNDIEKKGYGNVPININDVISSHDDEIKFIISATSKKHSTYTYSIPIPIGKDGKIHYVAKATLCYIPNCSRNQGVDYTNSELGIKFGRIDKNDKIKSINKDIQGVPGEYCYEKDARKEYRKWDNIKHIKEKFNSKTRPKMNYGKNYGLNITSTQRFKNINDGINFSVVVTLKNTDGDNKIDNFIKQSQARGWVVNPIDVHSIINVMNEAESNIELK